jgi:O-antigen/teichoic acid export membrane protein
MRPLLKLALPPSVLVILDQAFFSGSNFLLTLFLANALDLKEFGIFSTITLITLLALSITNALIVQPFQVLFPKKESKNQYLTFLFFGQGILLFILVGLIVLLYSLFPNQILTSLASKSGLVFVVGYLFQDFFRKIFLGIEKLKSALVIDLIFLITVALCFFLSKQQITLETSLYIIGCCNIVSSIPGIWFVIKKYQYPASIGNYYQTHLSQGKWLLSTSFLQWGSSNLFVLLSGAYLGIESLAALRLTQSIFGMINIVLQTVENYFLPKVAALFSQNLNEAKKYLNKITLQGSFLFGGLLILLCSFAKNIIVLAGGFKYEPYGYLIQVMSLLYFFIFLSYPMRIVIRVSLLNKTFFTGYVLSFISSVATFHFLLKTYELNGAIAGLIINQIIMMLYWRYELNKKQSVLWK